MYRVRTLQDRHDEKRKSDPHGFGYGVVTATDMEVTEFRQILVWPLALDHPSLKAASPGSPRPPWRSAHEITAEAADKLAGADRLADHPNPWTEQSDLLQHVDPGNGDQFAKNLAYQEYVYFHSFVQRFLYPTYRRSEAKQKPLRLFQRGDLKHADVVLPHVEYGTRKGQWCFSLDIDRLNLYLFDCGVAMPVMEVVARCVTYTGIDENGATNTLDTPLTVADALRLQNALRRCYAPYLAKMNDGTWLPAEVPERVTFYGADRTPIIYSRMTDARVARDVSAIVDVPSGEQRPTPLFDHWSELLPLGLVDAPNNGKVVTALWRHVVDERIPSLIYLTTRQSPRLLRRGDHVRLCFMDDPGIYPYGYDSSILDSFEQRHCYDRFWNLGTRHMFSGYAYVVIAEDSWFSQNILRHHFRRHYFQIALLSHMEHAALLTYSGWISAALARAHDLGTAFAEDVLRIKEELLKFVHQYRFTGLSNQLQPAEMQVYWRRHLKLEELFQDVETEIETARDYLVARENRDQTQASTSLAGIAGLAAVVGLPLAFLGSNFVDTQQVFAWPVATRWDALLWAIGSIAITAAAAVTLIRFTSGGKTSLRRSVPVVARPFTRMKAMLSGSHPGHIPPRNSRQRVLDLLVGVLAISLVALAVVPLGCKWSPSTCDAPLKNSDNAKDEHLGQQHQPAASR